MFQTDASQLRLSNANSNTGFRVLAQLQFIWSVSAHCFKKAMKKIIA
jgi:hypothetical protein